MTRSGRRPFCVAKVMGAVTAASLAAAGLLWGCSADGIFGADVEPKINYAGSGEGCSVRADGVCDINGGEDCDCVDCKSTAYCRQDAGIDCDAPEQNDGLCDPISDFCVCDDCRKDPYCQDPSKTNCVQDGQCQGFLEGCLCDDCGDAGRCQVNREASCSAEGDPAECGEDEGCDCISCLWTKSCACTDDGVCAPDEPCICDDCESDPYCITKACQVDCVCDIFGETCACSDCANECGMDAGACGAGGSGGSGGSGGDGGSGDAG